MSKLVVYGNWGVYVIRDGKMDKEPIFRFNTPAEANNQANRSNELNKDTSRQYACGKLN